MTLFDDTLTVLETWQPTSEEGDQGRRQTLQLLEAGPIALTRAHRPGHVTASALIVDENGRLLLCLHGRLHKWMQLGGHCEQTDETVAGAALREATEESGIAGLTIDPHPLDVDIHPVHCKAADGEPSTPTRHYDIRYRLHAPAGAVEQVSAESTALGWFTPGDLPTPLASGMLRLAGLVRG